MSSEKPLKVLIVGASISGLTLAHCLDRANIDYEVFDGYPVAPPVGASICIFPNGSAVLDQLGLYESLIALGKGVDHVWLRLSGGKALRSMENVNYLEQRAGYPGNPLPRQDLIQMLYDHLPDKSKVHAGKEKKVLGVEHLQDGVILHTADGAVARGDLVVGCDGIHSTIRSEMWRIANAVQPGALAEDHSAFASEYRCLFGISDPVQGVPAGDSHLVTGKPGYLLFTGINGEVFWFLYQKMDRKYTYPEIARFSRQEAEALALQHLNDPLTDKVTFGDIWKERKTFTLLPMEEGVVKNWHWGRIAVLGDAAHKVAVNLGQGGNSAIEDAAALANSLNAAVKSSPSRNLSFAELKKALSQYQASRLPRMEKVGKFSMDVCRFQGEEGIINFPLFVTSYWLKRDPWVDMQAGMARGGMTLDFVPAPKGIAKSKTTPQKQSGILPMTVGLLWGFGIGFFVKNSSSSGLWMPKFGLLG
ncbi:fad binding domain-containing protein [Neofusicoccum parvum]|nr:fad binding domain-containing protein [Neofusicoccum parvum]